MEQVPLIVGGYEYCDGARYFGEWNKKGERSGFGCLRLSNSTTYVGYFSRNIFSGLGVLRFPDGSRYEGEFVNGWFHGYGVFVRGDGMKFEGQFHAGKICGYGINHFIKTLGHTISETIENFAVKYDLCLVGLITYANGFHGFPRNEGLFQNCRMICRKNCGEVILKAQKTSYLARHQKQCQSS